MDFIKTIDKNNYNISLSENNKKINEFKLLDKDLVYITNKKIPEPNICCDAPGVSMPSTTSTAAIDNLSNFIIGWSDTQIFYLKSFYKNGGTKVPSKLIYISKYQNSTTDFKISTSPNGKFHIFTDRSHGFVILDETLNIIHTLNINHDKESENLYFNLPLVSINDSGEFLILWRKISLASDQYQEFYAEKFDSDGNPICTIFKVNLVGKKNSIQNIFPILDNDGNLLISWGERILSQENLETTDIRYIPLTRKNSETEISINEAEDIDLNNNSVLKDLINKENIKLVISNNFISKVDSNKLLGINSGSTVLNVINKNDLSKSLEIKLNVLPKCQEHKLINKIPYSNS